MQATPTFWDKAAPKYAKSKIGDMAAYEYTLDRSRSYLKRGDHVLELGCGTGMTALKLADAVDRFTATDVSGGMMAECQKRAEEAGAGNVEFRQAEVLDPSLQTGDHDVVMAHSLLHLLPEYQASFAAVNVMLKPGGLFISKTACLAEGGGLKSRMIRFVIPIMRAIGKAPFVKSFTVAELERDIEAAGFDIIEAGNFPNGAPPVRYLVARKR